MRTRSTTFLKCKNEAFIMNENLFPIDCLEILKKNYGERLESMKPHTIFDMVWDMMATTCDPDQEQIIEVVNDYIFS